MEEEGNANDQQAMSKFRYRHELRRTIHLFGSFAVAFSFISVTTGIFGNFERVLDTAGPAGFWTWPLVTAGQLLVALVFADLAAKIPLTGYSYQWVSRMAGKGLGWFAGWVSICFLIIVIPSVDHAMATLVGHLSQAQHGAIELKLLVCGLIAVQALIQIFGVRFADRLNSAAVFTEVIGLVGLVIVLAALILKNQPSMEILFRRMPVAEGQSYLQVWVMACLLGAYTIVGFESAANLAEETQDAANTVPKAVIGSVLVSGIVGMLFLIVTVLGIRNLDAVVASPHPLPYIIEDNLGRPVAFAFFVLVAISIFACGLVIMASGSRMVFAMARDRVFLGNDLFSRLSPRTSVPVPAIVLVAGLAILCEWFSESLTQLLATATVLPAIIYLITVVAFGVYHHHLPVTMGRFTLGRWARPIALLASLWLIGVIGILTIPAEFRTASWVSLGVCVVGVGIYWLFIAPRIAAGEAGISAVPVGPLEDESTTSHRPISPDPAEHKG